MSTTESRVEMNLEVQIIPVSDVDRAKGFYEQLGWRLDDDVAPFDALRIVQFTPPGSGPRSRSAGGSPQPRRARLRAHSSCQTSRRPMTGSPAVASK
jgi:catechol 2,3-dioxygenase-like lactoylglutathione lyase family enzyme